MRFSKKLILSTVVGSGLLAFSALSAQATPMFLGLGMDASGSISTAEFELQRNGYINVLESFGQQLEDNEVYIAINQFSSSVTTELGLTQVTLASVQDGGVIKTALEDMVKIGGGTNIGISIDDLVAEFQTQAGGFFDKAVIDISTDGAGSLGTAVDDALAAGIGQVNCLGIGSGANCDFIGGTDAFSITAATFDDFETALRTKISAEVGIDDVPEPATLALFGAGLLGLGAARLRRRKMA